MFSVSIKFLQLCWSCSTRSKIMIKLRVPFFLSHFKMSVSILLCDTLFGPGCFFGACLNLAKCQWASSPSVSGTDCDGLYRWCTGCSLWMWWWFCWSSQREDQRSVEIRILFVSWRTGPLSRTCSLLDGWMNLPLSRAMLSTAWLSAWSCLLSMPPEPSTTSSLPVRTPSHTGSEYSLKGKDKSLKLFSLCSVKLEPRRCWKVKSQKVTFVCFLFSCSQVKKQKP